jgi:GT2 family glycosyltransferase
VSPSKTGIPPKKVSTRPSVSVVIVNYNGGPMLAACVRCIAEQPYRPHEVIIVDNGSGDNSLDMALRAYPASHVLRNTENAGFASANNRGVEAASGDVIILLNNDTKVTAGWIEALLNMLAQPGVGAVTSRVVTEGVHERFYTMNGTLNYLGYNIMRHFSDTSRVFFGGGASLAFRKADIPQPFLPEYFLYHEDVFLSWRLRLRGLDIRMAQDSLVYHIGSATSRRQPSWFVTFYQERNRLLNSLLFYEVRTLALLIPLFLSDAVAKLLLACVGRGKNVAGIIAAYIWPLRNPGRIRRWRKMLQAERTVRDREILRFMSPKVLDADGRVARLVNAIALRYVRMAGLYRHE